MPRRNDIECHFIISFLITKGKKNFIRVGKISTEKINKILLMKNVK